jgi:AraC-like DNA-binding protein
MVFYDDVIIGSGGSTQACPRDTLMIWTPADGHRYGNPKRRWHHSWMHCDGRMVERFLAAERVPRGAPIRLADASFVDRYLLAIHTELSTRRRPDMVIVRNHVHSWIREIARAARGGEGGPGIPQSFLELRLYLETHYREPQRLSELAARMHLSVPHLCSEFKKHFGVPVIDYVIRRRMREAAYLLHDRNLNVTQIARRVGYDDIFHFSKLFKKHYGRSPRNVRTSYVRARR